MDNVVKQDDHTWMEEAKQREVRDLRVLDYFYTGVEDVPESYHMEKKRLRNNMKRQSELKSSMAACFICRRRYYDFGKTQREMEFN